LARVAFDVRSTSEREIIAALARAGYQATPITTGQRAEHAELAGAGLALSLVVFLNQICLAFVPRPNELAALLGVRLALAGVVLLLAGPALARRGLKAKNRGRLGRETVIFAASLVALLLASCEIVAITGLPAP